MKKLLSIILCICVLTSALFVSNIGVNAAGYQGTYRLKIGESKTIYSPASGSMVDNLVWDVEGYGYRYLEIMYTGFLSCNVRAVDYPPDGVVTLECSVYYTTLYGSHSRYTDTYQIEIERPIDTLYFDANGGSVSTSSVKIPRENSVGHNLPTPKRRGYLFAGWYTARNGGRQLQAYDTLSGNMTVYARWRKNVTYTVRFSPRGGKLNKTYRKVKNGNAIGKLPTPKRKGYFFDGWYTKATGGKKITASKPIKANMRFYAHWTKRIRITLKPRGGTIIKKKYKEIRKGSKIGKLGSPKRKNYYFGGWYTKAKGGKRVTAKTVFKRNSKIYAHWLKKIKVKFNPVGGKVSRAYNAFKEGSKIGALPTATRAHYTFAGWYTAKVGGKKISKSTKFKSSATVYAQWKSDVKITLNPAGGTVSKSTVSAKYNSLPSSLPEPEREGYSFYGWYTAKGVSYDSVKSFKADTELFARWSRSTSDFRYVTDNKTATIIKCYNVGSKVVFPSSIEGWDVSAIGEDILRDEDSVSTVVIPEGVTTIEGGAFCDCYNLTSISLPSTLTTIGGWAFYYCFSLKEIAIPANVKKIGANAFHFNRTLETVRITDLAAWCGIDFGDREANPLYRDTSNRNYYEKKLYLNNVQVTDLVIPQGVTSIGAYAFENCTGLKKVTIPNSVTSIGKYAFYECFSLENVDVPNSVKSIGENAFAK